MIKITNGVNIFEVTRGAFDGIYSRQGYVIVNDKVDTLDVEKQVPEKTEDEKFLEEIIEKPVSQWNKEEVKRFATLNNIKIAGTKNVGEAKEIIKNFIESNLHE